MSVGSPVTRILAWIATFAVWAPIALMLLTSAVGSSRAGAFLMDFLMGRDRR